jgi:lipoprotein-anchoring transpeptidase ErfK/SrfK
VPAEQHRKSPRFFSERIVGGEGVYLVKKKETLRLVGSRLGVSWRQLARLNRLNPDKLLQPGQKISYNNRRIVPKKIKDGILVNIPERKLYLFKDDRLNATYPVAAGMAKKNDKTVWRTPTGRFRIVDKKENPSWRVPPSIQKEMEEEGDEVLDIVPPGPKNPLGKYALKTSLGGIMIHSTIRPASIYTFSSHGCIRVMPEHMEALFRDVSVNMPGEIIYQPVMIEVTGDGRVFLEVNRDIYEQVKDMKAQVKGLVAKKGVADQVSWAKIDQVIKESTGIAEDVTLQREAFLAGMEQEEE